MMMTEQNSKNKKVTLRVDLDPDLGEKFLNLKKRWGLKTKTETIRHLINDYYSLLEKTNPSQETD